MSTEIDVVETDDDELELDVVDEDKFAETDVLPETTSTDNVGDVSVEINVEQLIADIEAEGDEEVAKKKEIRRKLEDLAEEKSFEDTYAFDLEEN
jgi:hypothetical protein